MSDPYHSFAIACNGPSSGQVCAPSLALSYTCAGCCASKGSHRATLVPIRLRKMLHFDCEPIPSDSSAHQAQNNAPFRLRTNFTTHCPCCCLTSPRTRRNITRGWWQVPSWRHRAMLVSIRLGTMLPQMHASVSAPSIGSIREAITFAASYASRASILLFSRCSFRIASFKIFSSFKSLL